MCGITGWVAFERDLRGVAHIVDAMLETIASRGPDAAGTWYAPNVALGHRRLAVIDRAGGRQPMTVEVEHRGEPRTLCLVYGGEVYNHVELRDELRRLGHRFHTSSDTEVVLRAYLEWGHGLADRLNGMYAFCIWDPRQDRLVMVRDRLGVKPLFFFPTADGVLFGSEPKAILAHPDVTPAVDADGFRELCSLVKSRRRSLWAGIRAVEPGSVVTVDRTGVREQVYWRLQARPHTDDAQATVHRVRELLSDIVGRQLHADVPRCVLLSGGLDSSALAALAARHLADAGEKVRSFVVDFVGQADNFVPSGNCVTPDTRYADDVAAFIGARHSTVLLDHTGLAAPDLRRTCVRAVDEPFVDDGFNSLYLLFRAIREQSTVALSGEAADEVFGGYPWFHAGGTGKVDPWMRYLVGVRGGWVTQHTMLSADFIGRLELRSYAADIVSTAVAEVDRPPGEVDGEWRMRKMLYLHLTRMLAIPLDRADRMSMATGLELRVPYCDHRLVEYVFNTPWSGKTSDGREKSLLRQAVRDALPGSVVDRVKSGYPLIHDPAYTRALIAQAQQLLADRHPVLDLVDRIKLRRLVRGEVTIPHPEGRRGLEHVLSLATWLDLYRPELRLP